MRVFHIFNIVTIDPYMAKPTTSPFRWGWDFNHWVPCMFHYPLRPHMQNHPILKTKPTKTPISLNESITSNNRFKLFFTSPMPSASSAMVNNKFHTSFRWEIKFGFTCKKNALQDPIGSFV
jgi:hypothetical protein